MDLLKNINVDKLGDVAKEVEKSVDLKKVASAATSGGKLDVKAAANAVKDELSDDEIKNITNKAKDVVKK